MGEIRLSYTQWIVVTVGGIGAMVALSPFILFWETKKLVKKIYNKLTKKKKEDDGDK